MDVGGGFGTMREDEGVLVSAAHVNGFTVSELRFPPGYVQAEFEPELAYLAVVLAGGLEKSFRLHTMQLRRASAVTMPAGEAHSARFGSSGARVVIVKPNSSDRAAMSLDRLAELTGRGLTWLAWRLAAELRATDAAAPLAAEGYALELLAATSRELKAEWPSSKAPAWLSSAEELLRARIGDCVGLGQLADEIGVHPAHLARSFRLRYGVSVGEYGRRLRLAWAAAEIARGDAPLATIAAQAGFSDQSHFTRLFKRYVGTTPARYREETQSTFHDA
jgi:AraC family transcriptional regulator